ncbi:hypothetical protein [Dictyobacter kobayashii]|uniref:Uncharacterized protein n=1 Tax=Dictyobacter kobayashii TaxID=2014872 RepID=A0A402AER7_9CHLR|nr:hypothetical protein [Dictyobacter kobayashii]GCE17591.1 hypothetical protein KDK_13910 [Dictyobacter kobayashii]
MGSKQANKPAGRQIAILNDLGNRPLRVRPVRYMGREWWAIDSEDIWPGMVMDLRRLGFESVAMDENVLVREGSPEPEMQMEGPNALNGLKPFPAIHPTIQIRRESYLTDYSYSDLEYLDEDDDFEDDDDEWEAEDLDAARE